ncbi:hypothetical protein [Candidatus Nitrosacidococcus sp. I8]|uniref:hypothetical protein n=1 Tax=Candidatus Nitrosacidococcus sp. I8 TaxID=2942908 RepID=UPI0022279915|nr:hypothetical protein [Candidatus Nitrosacidococcus sp. I8]CAH9017728.1 hypothetical protein NURINAE_00520 [Candidatus Nitrosacidococcus sp. I8]
MHRKPLVWLLLFFILGIALEKVNAEEALTSQDIDTVVVKVTGIKHDYERFGLKEEALVKEISQSLEDAGFSVVDNYDEELTATILINLRLISSYLGYSYALSVKMLLPHYQGRQEPLVLWSGGSSGFLRDPELSRLHDYIMEEIDKFLTSV